MIENLYRAEPLLPSQAAAVYPLVSLLHPGITPEEWQRFVRRATRVPRQRGGLMAIRDGRGYYHAVFSCRVGEDLAASRSLRVSDVLMGRLPGVTLPRALVTCAEQIAAQVDSDSIAVDLEQSMVAPEDREALRQAGFDASGLILTRNVAATT